jgi:hypothetical protein
VLFVRHKLLVPFPPNGAEIRSPCADMQQSKSAVAYLSSSIRAAIKEITALPSKNDLRVKKNLLTIIKTIQILKPIKNIFL